MNELEKAAYDYINSDAVEAENMQLAFGDFINGAHWQKERLINKACEWLEKESDIYIGYYDKQGLIDNFKKAMEELK